MYEIVRRRDPEVADALQAEVERQRLNIELIASENFATAVMEAQVPWLQTACRRVSHALRRML